MTELISGRMSEQNGPEVALTAEMKQSLIDYGVSTLTALQKPRDIILVNSRAWHASSGTLGLLQDRRLTESGIVVPTIIAGDMGFGLYKKFLTAVGGYDEVSAQGFMSDESQAEFRKWLQQGDHQVSATIGRIEAALHTRKSNPVSALILDDARPPFEDPGATLAEEVIHASVEKKGVPAKTEVVSVFGEDDTWQQRMLLHRQNSSLTDTQLYEAVDEIGVGIPPETSVFSPDTVRAVQLLGLRRYGRTEGFTPKDKETLFRLDMNTSVAAINATNSEREKIFAAAGIGK